MRDYRMNFLGSSNILMFYPGKEPKKIYISGHI